MVKIAIRHAKPTDLPHVCEIERLSFEHPYPPSYIHALASLSPDTFLVAEKDGQLVGYAAALLEGRGLGHIFSIAVLRKHRRKGVGTNLVNRMIEILKKHGASSIRLEVRRKNRRAQKLYEKLGFKKAYKVKGYYEDGEDCIVMIKTTN